MGLFKTAARTAVASSVHGRVQRRQQQKWAAQSHQGPPPAAAPVVAAPPAPPVAPVVAAAPAAGVDMKEQLEMLSQLSDLRAAGVLTDAEFEAKKAQILQL